MNSSDELDSIKLERDSEKVDARDIADHKAYIPSGIEAFEAHIRSGLHLSDSLSRSLLPLEIFFTLKNNGRIKIDSIPKLHDQQVLDLIDSVYSSFIGWVPAKQGSKPIESSFIQKIIYEDEFFPPEFPGGLPAFFKYIAENMTYPSLARNQGIEGRVYVQFVVDKDGSVTEVKAIKGIGGGCDEEAERVVATVPKFNPGYQNGVPVKVRMVLPIIFKLSYGSRVPAEKAEETISSWIQTKFKIPSDSLRPKGLIYVAFDLSVSLKISNIRFFGEINELISSTISSAIYSLPKSVLRYRNYSDQTLIIPFHFGGESAQDSISLPKGIMLPLINFQDHSLIDGGVTISAIGTERHEIHRPQPGNPFVSFISSEEYESFDQVFKDNAETGVYSVRIANKDYRSIPSQINTLKTLIHLDLEGNDITELPSELTELQNLKKLFLQENELSELPPNFQNLKELTSLSLATNKFTHFPQGITKLSKLEALGLGNNQIENIPLEIAEMKSLKLLVLSGNLLTALPPNFQNLTDLTVLSLSDNKFTQFPLAITQLSNLGILDLGANQIDSIPIEIAKMKSLKHLILSGNPLTTLPPEIQKLKLEKLEIVGSRIPKNEISALQKEMKNTEIIFE